jgi:hypothetical protein
VSAEGVRFSGDSAHVVAPIAPGMKQLSLRYQLPRGAFPVRLPLATGAGVLEVLVGDSAARVEAPGMARTEEVSLEGRVYQRYLAENVPGGALLQVTLAGASPARLLLPLLAIFAAAVALALGTAAGRRAPVLAAVPRPAENGSTPDALAAAIAALDNAVATQTGAARAAHDARRAALKARLVDALAARPSRR